MPVIFYNLLVFNKIFILFNMISIHLLDLLDLLLYNILSIKEVD